MAFDLFLIKAEFGQLQFYPVSGSVFLGIML